LGHVPTAAHTIYAEVTIRQLQEVHARCHPSARQTEEKPLSSGTPIE
jgi:hypothetical protein